MKKHFIVLLVIFMVSVLGCKKNQQRPDEISVSWNVVENGYKNAGFLSEFIFKNNSKSDLTTGWTFYFNFINEITNDSNSLVVFEHINGDFWKMSPSTAFKLAAGDSIKIPFVSTNWATNYTDAPKGGFFVFADRPNTPVSITNIFVMPFLTKEQTTRNANDIMPVETPAIRYEKYSKANLHLLKSDELLPIIPSPMQFNKIEGVFSLTNKTVIYYDKAFVAEANFLAEALSKNLGKAIHCVENANDNKNGILLKMEKPLVNIKSEEAYSLDVLHNNIVIKSTSTAGIFYGIQSLRALLTTESYKSPQESINIPCASIIDAPLFENRSIHFDIARNFQNKASILKFIDLMALYKLNKLHFHFCDDEGWRLEIPSLPELTSVGAYRYYNPDDPNTLLPSFGSGPNKTGHSGSGFLTRSDFIEILKFATIRHIEIIPEIDMPGHARAAIKSMNARYDRLKNEGKLDEANQYLLTDLNDSSHYRSVQGWNDNVVCVCQAGLYNFINTVTKDLKAMYDDAGAKLTTIHSGGDEVPKGVWEKSPLCQEFISKNNDYTTSDLKFYFIKRFKGIMDKYSIKTAGWEEIVLKNVNGRWEAAKEMVNDGYIPYTWNCIWGWGMEDISYKLANAGFPVVMCNVTNLYFDLAYAKDPQEPGYYWGSYTDTRKAYEFTPFDIRNCAYDDLMGHKLNAYKLFENKELLTEKGKSKILGIEGLLWSENITNSDILEYMAFPKLLGLAERAWTKQPAWASIKDSTSRLIALNKDWNVFANTLGQKELPKLDYYFEGIKYRIAPPAVIKEDGFVKVIAEFPGMEIRYTTDGSEPTMQSEIYKNPIKTNGTIKLKIFATNGRYSRSCIIE